MITLENTMLKVQISEIGAELMSIYDKTLDRECLWNGNPEIWKNRSPLLFPVIGNCKNREYRYKGVTYSMPQHGNVRFREFKAEQCCGEKVTFTLVSDAETHENYPFDYVLKVIYTLEEGKLKVNFEVENTMDETIYFSLGGHPGFMFDGALEDQQFEFNSDENLDRLLLNEKLTGFSRNIHKDFVVGGAPIPVTEHLFDRDALVFHDFKFTKISLVNKKSGHGVTMDLTGFPYVGLWSKPGAPYACIEPWYGLADYEDFDGELPEKDGIESLEAGKTFHAAYTLEFC